MLALLSGGLQILIFPKPSLYFLCWIAIVPLLYALIRGRGGEGELLDSEGRSLRPLTLGQGFLLAWVSGIVWYAGTCYWIYPVMHGYGHLVPVLAMFITLGYCLAMGLHHGLFGLLVVLMVRRSTAGNRRPLLTAPFFWVAVELLRERVVSVPWEPLGNSQVSNIPLSRIAEVTGVYGVSFAIMLVNCAFTAALLFRGKRRKNLLVSAIAATVALQMGALARPAPFPTTQQAVLVQPNIPVLENDQWTRDYYDHTVAEMAQLSVKAIPKNPPDHPGLIVWPESPAPFFISDPRLQHWLVAIAQDTNSFLIVGSIGWVDGAPAGEPQPLNSALVIDPKGNILGRYDKMHLVPFGEYVPFKRILFFANKLTREVGEWGRGTDRKVFDLNGTKTGVFICYESIFPDEIREFAMNGAQLFVNISNDGWYGETGAPFQHLDMTRMRAIENHRWILLSTNSGTTTSIDPYGRMVVQAERNVRAALVAPFAAVSESTFYSRNGDVFAWICVVISLVVIFFRFRIAARTMLEAPTT